MGLEVPYVQMNPYHSNVVIHEGEEYVVEGCKINPSRKVKVAIKVVVENEPPVPIWPCRSEVQTIDAVSAVSSSSASVTLPAKAMMAPRVALGSLAGAVIETVGAVEGSFADALAADPSSLDASHEAVRKITDALKGDFATVLMLTIPSEAAGDAD